MDAKATGPMGPAVKPALPAVTRRSERESGGVEDPRADGTARFVGRSVPATGPQVASGRALFVRRARTRAETRPAGGQLFGDADDTPLTVGPARTDTLLGHRTHEGWGGTHRGVLQPVYTVWSGADPSTHAWAQQATRARVWRHDTTGPEGEATIVPITDETERQPGQRSHGARAGPGDRARSHRRGGACPQAIGRHRWTLPSFPGCQRRRAPNVVHSA